MTLDHLQEPICPIHSPDGAVPAYIVGKTFYTMLGSAVFHVPSVHEEIPFLHETHVETSYRRIPVLDHDNCRIVLRTMHETISKTKSFARRVNLRRCALQTMESWAMSPINVPWVRNAFEDVVTQVALGTKYHESVICSTFGKEKVMQAFAQAIANGMGAVLSCTV